MAEKIVKVTTVHEVSMWHSASHGCVVAFEANGDHWPESAWTPAMHAAAEELRAQGAELGEDECEAEAWRGDRFKMRVVPDGLELVQVTGATKGWSATFFPATLKHAADEHSDPNGWARAFRFFIANLPADLCLTDDGLSVRPMATNEVRDVVTGKGLRMVVRNTADLKNRYVVIDGAYNFFRDQTDAEAWKHRKSHPCSLPSNRLRVEAFLKDSEVPDPSGPSSHQTGTHDAACAVQENTTAAVLPEAHSGSPSGEKCENCDGRGFFRGRDPRSAQVNCPTCNGTGRKAEESDGKQATGAKASAALTRPPCIPSHIPDTDWTVIEGRAVWRGERWVHIETSEHPDGSWVAFEGALSPEDTGIQSADVPQSLFLAARRWMGWEKLALPLPDASAFQHPAKPALTAVDLTELREAWNDRGCKGYWARVEGAIEKLLSGGAP